MLTNSELLDSIISQMYEMFRALLTGNYAMFCAHFAEIMSKLCSLRDGVRKENELHDQHIKDLKDQLKRATTLEPEPGETVIGGETTTFNYDPRREDHGTV